MAIKITGTDGELTDTSFADGEQSAIFREDMVISKALSWPDEWEQEESFAKLDFERDLRKVSRKIKK